MCPPHLRDTGLGHRICNILQGMLLSVHSGIPLAFPQLEHSGNHGGYPGADDLFKLDPALFPTSTKECPRPSKGKGKDSPGVVKLTLTDNVFPRDQQDHDGQEVGWGRVEQDCGAVEQWRNGLTACNTM